MKETPLERLDDGVSRQFSIEELDEPIALELEPREPSARDMVSPEEFERFKDIYNMLDRMELSPEYKEVLADRFSEMDTALKGEYSKYADRLVCLDADYKGGAHFSPDEGGFRIDQKTDLRSPLGAGSQFFHESAHMIDHLKGQELGFPVVSARNGMTDAIRKDLDAALEKVQETYGCDSDAAKVILSGKLTLHPINSACVSDVFGGVSQNQVSGIFGHSKEYWQNGPKELPGMEAFASITEIVAGQNTKALAFTEKYLPNTMAEYNAIIGRLN